MDKYNPSHSSVSGNESRVLMIYVHCLTVLEYTFSGNFQFDIAIIDQDISRNTLNGDYNMCQLRKLYFGSLGFPYFYLNIIIVFDQLSNLIGFCL